MRKVQLTAASRISIGLVTVMLSLLLGAQWLGFVPDRQRAVLEGRRSLCEALAVQYSLAVLHGNDQTLREAVRTLVENNDDVQAAAVRRGDGIVLAHAGPDAGVDGAPMPGAVEIPIYRGAERWGAVEVRFAELQSGSWLARLLGGQAARLSLFLALAGFLAFQLYLRKTLRHLDPSSVIPDRVRAMLDSLAEAVLVLDSGGDVVLANEAFARTAAADPHALQGRRATSFAWRVPGSEEPPAEFPWARTLRDGSVERGVPLALQTETQGVRALMVNVSPILGADGSRRGALATFDDVTQVEQQNAELEKAMAALEKSKEEIDRQNRELQILATRDPLTGCLNRRSFFAEFTSRWSAAGRYEYGLGCVMVDIDHFKSINDTHGHAVGDEVLQAVGKTLQDAARGGDIVCRYGGEEFCVLVSHADTQQTAQAAERFRKALADLVFPNLRITASFGASATDGGADTLQAMLEQADQALYAAKHGGRNRVVRWDEVGPNAAKTKSA